MEISNLQKALAKNSGKACVSIIRDDYLKVIFGVDPELHIVDQLHSLTQNACFALNPGSTLQNWRFKVSKPQSAFEIGKAIVQDLREKGIEVEVEIGTGTLQDLKISAVDNDNFLQSSLENLGVEQ